MKIQYMGIIFIIIMMPIILVLSAYMQMQVDNLDIALQYDTKLFEATLDGIQAFELNTVNNRFSQVADSLKRDVEAGINTFITSMSNNLGFGGVNNEYLLPYIPAVLFTLYDGYYIYAPTYAEELEETEIEDTDIDGKPIKVTTEVSKNPTVFDHENMLKPYIYYTTRYKSGQKTDFIVNYTLDNYIIVYGNIQTNGKENAEYVTRSGFLSDPANISYTLDKTKLDTVLARKILEYILPPRTLDNMTQAQILENFRTADLTRLKNIDEVSLTSEMGARLFETMKNDRTISDMRNDDILDALFDSTINEVYENDVDKIPATDGNIIDETIDVFSDVKYKGLSINDSDAKRYYIKSLRFTNWVNNNLSNIEAGDAVDDMGNTLTEFAGSDVKIFKTDDGKNDPEKYDSEFTQHRMNCIQLSIQTNLNTAIAQYNVEFFQEKTYNLTMPLLNPVEWNEITNNISMVTFFQGMKVGNKVYNNYVVVSSNKNKETINTDDIYYINTDEVGRTYYHKSDCPYLKDDTNNVLGLKNIDYDVYKDEDKEKNLVYSFNDRITEICNSTSIDEIYGCYHCIVNRNYEPVENLNNNRLKAIYTAIAKEKNNLYKVNEYYNVDILSTYVAPPVTVLGTLSEIAKLGDYVTYTSNGYSNWRILSKDTSVNKVEIISDGSVQTVSLAGRDLSTSSGFATFTEKVRDILQNVANYYLDSTYSANARVVGSNEDASVGTGAQDTDIPDVAKMQASGTLSTNNNDAYSSGYWLLSTARDEDKYNVMYITQDGKTFGRGTLFAGGTNYTKEYGVRPIITLNNEVKVVGGSGTQKDPWQLSL